MRGGTQRESTERVYVNSQRRRGAYRLSDRKDQLPFPYWRVFDHAPTVLTYRQISSLTRQLQKNSTTERSDVIKSVGYTVIAGGMHVTPSPPE